MRLRQSLVAIACVLACPVPGTAQPGPPQITKVVVNGGANLTTADLVSVEVFYNHPAAPGAPIPYYRIRVKPPGGVPPPWSRFFDALQRNMFTVNLVLRGGQPLGGTYEIQVQLQDAGGRVSNTGIGHVIRASPTPSALPSAVEYRVSGAQVATLIGYARLRGYLNTAQPLNFGATCSSQQNAGYWHLRVAKMVVPVPLGTEALPNPTCLFGFFKGKKLQYGWRFKSATFERWSVQPADWDDYGPSPSGLDAFFSITVTPVGPLGQGEVRLKDLVLEGPPGATWQDAFVQ